MTLRWLPYVMSFLQADASLLVASDGESSDGDPCVLMTPVEPEGPMEVGQVEVEDVMSRWKSQVGGGEARDGEGGGDGGDDSGGGGGGDGGLRARPLISGVVHVDRSVTG